MATPKHILVSGAGPAGLTFAYWARKAGFKITIIERDAVLPKTGQSIDVRNAGVEIMRKMNIIEAVKANCTGEKGVAWTTKTGKIYARFGATGNDDVQGFTSEFEIIRGGLVEVLRQQIKDDPEVSWIYGNSVVGISQSEKSVHVTFEKDVPPTTYDLVVACDGVGSPVRNLAFDIKTRDVVKSLNAYCAYVTIDHNYLKEYNHWAVWYNTVGGRMVFLRPDPAGKTRASLILSVPKSNVATREKYEKARRAGMDAYKQQFITDFRGAGWITDDILDAIPEADGFYGSPVSQIKMDKLYKDRVALVGDAGYCPTFLTGMGTTSAMVGAYVLAGELKKASDAGQSDVSALQNYQNILLPFVKKVQKIAPGGMGLMVPQTRWGVAIQHALVWFVGLFADMFQRWFGASDTSKDTSKDKFVLPEYNWGS